ncbi:hypothetical protein [Weeksella virosa]|uniref:Uncharacterized protein n=1 Tax=Weeksella virosa (strain ATCC 43766 / DSM 16922 / JCM 21250 / CCUG 30538 / CDC 9751 / IAM 14551 / NBRC 16016 / NCTC 11634 / CL345/78) TaxID=865938 RepID=F0NX88_WEEVC|nr:hypothetical protein [Weeksella virosa]ADX66862.1 hypothetical protein Weevi_0136 [Weeksella virosa DSM 16922]VEH63414.1 Uncharacterised protein [Weeksella virosa]
MKTTLKIPAIQHNYCRLTETDLFDYQNDILENGCTYAEMYWQFIVNEETRQKQIQITTQSKEYWRWFQNQFHLQVRNAFGAVNVEPTEPFVEQSALDALKESYVYHTNPKLMVQHVFPTKKVSKEIETICKQYEAI